MTSQRYDFLSLSLRRAQQTSGNIFQEEKRNFVSAKDHVIFF